MPDPLAHLAMLYTAGELAPADAADFEARLADDPAAQEALVQAVQLSALLHGTPARPDPGYRDAVRTRLRPAPRRRTAARTLALAATAAACLLLAPGGPATIPRPARPAPADGPSAAVAPAVPAEEVVALPPVEPPGERADADESMAEVWADLSNTDHLRLAHEEQQRHRTRAEDRPGSRLATLRPGRTGPPAADEGTE